MRSLYTRAHSCSSSYDHFFRIFESFDCITIFRKKCMTDGRCMTCHAFSCKNPEFKIVVFVSVFSRSLRNFTVFLISVWGKLPVFSVSCESSQNRENEPISNANWEDFSVLFPQFPQNCFPASPPSHAGNIERIKEILVCCFDAV